jgi:sterol desaturase/sphingolipid hydroxylase (fatty acid hydroxylase superfamily)
METYGKMVLVAMPVFLLLVLFEKWWGWRKGHDTVRTNDMISSLSSGITNVTKDVLGLSMAIISYGWLVDAVALVKIESTWLTYALAFIALDFAGYWVHRIAHEYNLFWNNHIIHHSSEEFNLACALRQSVSSIVRIFAIFLLPAALLGISQEVIAVVAPLHLFAQFWYHTQHIKNMGFLEHIIVTPAHHRVHHAINPEYLDKNYSQIFIFWDKLFGTFQPELPHVPAVYGVTRPVRTWNPVKINFMHLWLLMQDAWRARNWADKLRIWFMPLGWRPADVAEKHPVLKVSDVYRMEKYDPASSNTLLAWSWVQMLAVLALITYLFGNLAQIGAPAMFWYGGFVFAGVYAYTELMDRNPRAWLWELGKNGYGFFLLLSFPGWFGLDSILPGASYVVGGYLIISTVVTLWINRRQQDELRAVTAA